MHQIEDLEIMIEHKRKSLNQLFDNAESLCTGQMLMESQALDYLLNQYQNKK